jgi:antitoxin component of MazEF toxin-antitoxin module
VPRYHVEVLLKGDRSIVSPPFNERQEAVEELSALAEEMNKRGGVVKRSWTAVSEGVDIAALKLVEDRNYRPDG